MAKAAEEKENTFLPGRRWEELEKRVEPTKGGGMLSDQGGVILKGCAIQKDHMLTVFGAASRRVAPLTFSIRFLIFSLLFFRSTC